MKFITAVFLGIVEGFSEFLPISGSGHMALLHNLFQLEEATPLFNVTLHLALLLSIYITYRSEVRGVWHAGKGSLGHNSSRKKKSSRERNNHRTFVFVVIGTLPLIPAIFLRSPAAKLSMSSLFVAAMLFLNGFVIWFSEKHGRMTKTEDKISRLDILMVGFAQLVSIFPGLSRAGTTISVGMLRGFPRKFAIKYSFLLRVPSLIACSLIYLIEAVRSGLTVSMLPVYLVGSAFAVVSGVFALRFLRWICARNGFGAFAYYCWGAGIVTLLLSLIS